MVKNSCKVTTIIAGKFGTNYIIDINVHMRFNFLLSSINFFWQNLVNFIYQFNYSSWSENYPLVSLILHEFFTA